MMNWTNILQSTSNCWIDVDVTWHYQGKLSQLFLEQLFCRLSIFPWFLLEHVSSGDYLIVVFIILPQTWTRSTFLLIGVLCNDKRQCTNFFFFCIFYSFFLLTMLDFIYTTLTQHYLCLSFCIIIIIGRFFQMKCCSLQGSWCGPNPAQTLCIIYHFLGAVWISYTVGVWMQQRLASWYLM